MATKESRIAELTREWEDGANYGEAEPTHSASDYTLSEDDWAAYLGKDGAAEIVALLAESEEDYARSCDAQHAANTFRLEGDL